METKGAISSNTSSSGKSQTDNSDAKGSGVARNVLPKERLGQPMRIEWILNHRKMLSFGAQFLAAQSGDKPVYCSSIILGCDDNNSKPVKNFESLKPVLLKEFWEVMTRKTSHNFKGRVIHLLSIEDCSVGQQSTRLVVEDENGDTFPLCIYGYPYDSFPTPPSPKNVAIIQNNLGFGSRISIANPFVKVALNRLPYLRVDDHHTIVYHREESVVNRCRYCGEPGASHHCALCRRHYCSRECQTNDWKINKHKLICGLKFREL